MAGENSTTLLIPGARELALAREAYQPEGREGGVVGRAVEGMAISPMLWRRSCSLCRGRFEKDEGATAERAEESGTDMTLEEGRGVSGDGVGYYSPATTKMELPPGQISRKMGESRSGGPGKMRMLSVFMPYSVNLRTPVPACTDFIPPLAEVLSSGWRVPSEVSAEVAAEEGAVDVETKHTCVPGHACSLLRHYSLPSAS